jgi:hypothetical protein
MARLLSSSSDDERKEHIGQINAYEHIYRTFVGELARQRNSEE